MSKQNLIILGSAVTGVVLIFIVANSGSDNDATAGTDTQAQATQNTASVEVSEGASFPDFSLTDVDGISITNTSISEKPTIMWFTTTWCVPCQIGAKEVVKLDDEMGGDAFDVVVIFVDPKEDVRALRQWKKDFANEDWAIAFDNESSPVAQKINLKFLDSKYLLDTNGVVLNADFKIADESYLNVIRGVVSGV